MPKDCRASCLTYGTCLIQHQGTKGPVTNEANHMVLLQHGPAYAPPVMIPRTANPKIHNATRL